MLETFSATLSPMLVMLLCMVVGFVLKKKNLVPENTDKVISKLENYIFVPALVLSTFMTYCTVASIKEQYALLIYSGIALVIAPTIAIPLSRVFARNNFYLRRIYEYALTFGNFGFMGNAIVPAIIGSADPEILYKYLLFTLPNNILVYTWGVMILIPDRADGKKENPLRNLLSPIFISILLGILLGLTGIGQRMPSFLVTAIDYCKACMAPLAMVLTGFVIGGYSFKTLLSNKKVYVATALRLFVLPALILGILKLFGATAEVLVLALFAYATPLGLNTVVFPAAYGADTETGASMAMVSHTLCVITIPIMYALLLWVM